MLQLQFNSSDGLFIKKFLLYFFINHPSQQYQISLKNSVSGKIYINFCNEPFTLLPLHPISRNTVYRFFLLQPIANQCMLICDQLLPRSKPIYADNSFQSFCYTVRWDTVFVSSAIFLRHLFKKHVFVETQAYRSERRNL